MTGGFLDADVFRGLAFRILIFLTLALLPFGLISIFQTREIGRQANFNSELSLLALTGQASATERQIYQEAFGAAQALSAVTQIYKRDPQACNSFLAAYKDASQLYSFVGYQAPDGAVRCASRPVEQASFFASADENADRKPLRALSSLENDPFGAGPKVLIRQPFFLDGAFAGDLLVTIPQSSIPVEFFDAMTARPVDIVTFNADGDVVRASLTSEEIDANLPQDRALKALVGQQSFVFAADNAAGQNRVYAVVPLVPGVAYAMSIWRSEDLSHSATSAVGLSIFLPVIMWLASLIVAFWSLNRLAVRHIRKLGRQMRHFAYNRRVPRTKLGPGVPKELVEIQQSFVRMAESIVRDEAALEDNLRDKNILLKEVHHRVKNNLQLISSIMNMQIRRAETPDARQVLQRLQDRILGLATVHKNLYQSEALDRVEANIMVEEIVGQLLRVGLPAGRAVDIKQHYDSFEMDADDAAPLTLLVSEAVTNALKYLGVPPGRDRAYLNIAMGRVSENEVTFRLANSTSGAAGTDGTGLGTQLISAFARQLNGHVEVEFENHEHVMTLRFPLQERVKDRYDF